MTVEPSLRDGMLTALPSLRAFAISLTNDPIQADDLVQDTILRAWANSHRFEPGANLHAWLFTILRNLFHSEWRKRRREVEDVDGSYAAKLKTLPDQQVHLDFEDFRVALSKLSVSARGPAPRCYTGTVLRRSRRDLWGCRRHDQEPGQPRADQARGVAEHDW
jgi:RNA polymerase sigma-70 factor, ECF subfamily